MENRKHGTFKDMCLNEDTDRIGRDDAGEGWGMMLSTPNCVMGAWNTELAASHVASLEFTISPWHHQCYPIISAEHNSNINHCNAQAGSWRVAGLIGRPSSADHLNGDLGRNMTERNRTDIFHFSHVIVIGPCSWGTETLKTPSVL